MIPFRHLAQQEKIKMLGLFYPFYNRYVFFTIKYTLPPKGREVEESRRGGYEKE